MLDLLSRPWPWYVAGPLIGLVVPTLLLLGNRSFGVSDNLRHLCAAALPLKLPFLSYDWKKEGGWNLLFALGILLGGVIAARVIPFPAPLSLAEATSAALAPLDLLASDGILPARIFRWSVDGVLFLLSGGFLVGFGARYAGGCTSGHAITGLANLQLPSLLAVVGFFAGGLLATHLLLPVLF